MNKFTSPYKYKVRLYVTFGALDILHGKTCYNRLICIYL